MNIDTTRLTTLLLTTSLVAWAAACGGGTAAVSGGSSGSSGSSANTTVSDVVVTSAKVSPATIQFTLRGKKAVDATLEYEVMAPAEGGPSSGTIQELSALEASPNGVTHEVFWPFTTEFPAGFQDALQVRVTLGNGRSDATDPDAPVVVGNVAPAIDEASIQLPVGEVVGNVAVKFAVTDTSDLVDVFIEVNVDEANEFPDEPGSWHLAQPVFESTPPDPTLKDVFATETGSTVAFTWDVTAQFPGLDSGVKLRFRVHDKVLGDKGAELPLASDVYTTPEPIRVDNNAPPAVSLDDIAFALSDDQRRGIVVPYTLSDPEGDTPDVVFQWTLEGEPFVDLPDDEAQIEEILDDPALREQYRIATPYTMPLGGLAQPTGEANTVELPELASSRSHLLQLAAQPDGDLGRALDGYELELLRRSKIPEPLASTWADDPLDGPVAVLPSRRPTSAYVLDRAGASAWRVREIDLATGEVLAELATGTGEPDTMTTEHGGAALLVAAHAGSVPLVERIDLDTLDVRAIIDGARPLPGDTIRSLVSIGTEVALATSGDALVRLDYPESYPTNVGTVLDGLATPSGLAVDPSHTHRVYLAERDGGTGGRVLSVRLDAGTAEALPVDAPGLPRPEALAVERGGRLAVVTDGTPGDGTKELRSLQLGSSQVDVLTTGLPASAAGLVTGPDDLRLLSLEGAHDLAAGGGVVQRRTITGYDPARRVVTVGEAFAPSLSAALPWRVQQPARLAVAAGVPRNSAFVWDTRDLPGGQGRALLRLIARDADASVVEHDGGKPVLSGLAGEPLALGSPTTFDAVDDVALADLDGDGDDDIVSANIASSTLTVFFQSSPGLFDIEPDLTLGGPATTAGPAGVAAADLDGDGDTDIISANQASDTLTVFFQTGPGVFDPVPSLTLGSPTTTGGVNDVGLADLDGDGDVDIVSADVTVPVFLQTAPGIFGPEPSLTLGTPDQTGGALSVGLADLDGDGDVDIVTGNHGQDPDFGTATVFFQTGPGVFDPEPSVTLDIAVANDVVPLDVAAADLDGDGDADIVTANFGGNDLTVFFQTGPGVFDTVPALSLGDGAAGLPTGVAAADMDGDGDLDLVSANAGGDSLSVFFQEGPGVFDPVSSLDLGGSGTTDGAWKVVAADLDDNGHPDLVAASQFSDRVVVFFQRSAGSFPPEPSQTLGSFFSTGTSTGVATADFDGDGDADIVSANSGVLPLVNSSLTVYFQAGAGIFDPAPLFLGSSATLDGAADVAAADLDGDGDVDIVSANGFDLVGPFLSADGTDTLTVFLQTAPGVFDPAPSFTLGGPRVTEGAVSVVAADLDEDGDIDLVSANRGGTSPDSSAGTLTVFFQTAGLFDPVPSLTLGGRATTEGANTVAVADLDGDGDLDLACSNGGDSAVTGSHTLTVFFQTAPGVFDTVPALTLGGPGTTDGAVDLTAADVDGDGDVDLVCANPGANTLTVFVQTGAGVFDPVPSVTLDGPASSAELQSVTVADLDGDGDVDFVCGNPGRGAPGGPGNNTLTVFRQTRAGVFDDETLRLAGLPTVYTEVPVDVAAVDLDGDGDTDLVSANGPVSNVTVFHGAHGP